ncbi:MAG: type IV pilus modification protein PilV [Acidiferrobacterales bacterium]|nr:type IV pilus modification protein PilV [Acidiferrobacterales bacterium]
MSIKHHNSHFRPQSGFTLLEVMIALVIFSIGLLGLAGLQAGGLRSNTQAQLRTIATIQAYDMAERIRSNPRGVEDGDYNAFDDATPTAGDCISNTCTAAEMATYDYYEWELNTQNVLPSGHGTVSSALVGGGATRLFTVTVMWDEERTGVTGTNCSGDPTVDLKCYVMEFEP